MSENKYAFPIVASPDNDIVHYGLSKAEYIAMKLMVADPINIGPKRAAFLANELLKECNKTKKV